MKRLLSLMLAALLCVCCGAAFAESAAVKADYVGYWELESMSLFGISMDKADLDYNVVVNIHEDDTLLLAMDDTFAVVPVTYADEACTVAMGEEELMLLRIDAEDKLNMTLVVEGISMEMKLVRSKLPALDEAFTPYMGEWKLDHVSLAGRAMTAEDIGRVDLFAYEDGYGALVTEGEYMTFRLQDTGGAVYMYDTDELLFPMKINENDQLCCSIAAEGLTMDIVLNRAGKESAGAAERPEAELASPAEDQKYVVVTADRGTIRTEASISAEMIATAYKGEGFPYVDENADWYIVEVNGRTGYIHKGVSGIQ